LSQKGIELNERDFYIFKIIFMFRYCLGRHIKQLADFSTIPACDRRLKKLVEAKYIERKRHIWGIPYLYTLSHKGRAILGVNKKPVTIKLEQVTHDITVIDTVIYFLEKYNITLSDLTTEKELHSTAGFTTRKHMPDYVINKDGEAIAFEIELTAKAKDTLAKNVKTNYLNYDRQIWITDNTTVKKNLHELKNTYTLEIIDLENIKNGY